MVVSSCRAGLAGVVDMLLSGGGENAAEKGGSLETVSRTGLTALQCCKSQCTIEQAQSFLTEKP